MVRLFRAIGLGLLLTLALAFLARPGKPVPGSDGRILELPATLRGMKDGTAHQPFVRRQFVPTLLRGVDRITTPQWREQAAVSFRRSRWMRPLLFTMSEPEDFDSVVCLGIWLVCFTVYLLVFESEAIFYSHLLAPDAPLSPRWLFLLTAASCVVLVQLLRFNYIYDPPTLAFAALTIRAVRRERFWQLLLLAAMFSFNRETGFLVAGLTFFYWLHRGCVLKAFQQAAALSLVYLIVAGSLIYRFRDNVGSMAENNRAYLFHSYLHTNWKYSILALLSLCFYSFAVIRLWRWLPPTLKAMQWFVPLWIAMHLLWGWPTEWRVFFEIFPGVTLTVVALIAIYRESVQAVSSASSLSYVTTSES